MSRIVLRMCAFAASVAAICVALVLSCDIRSDEAEPQMKRVYTDIQNPYLTRWAEGIPPDLFQSQIDYYRDDPESVSSLFTIADLIQQSVRGEGIVHVSGY